MSINAQTESERGLKIGDWVEITTRRPYGRVNGLRACAVLGRAVIPGWVNEGM